MPLRTINSKPLVASPGRLAVDAEALTKQVLFGLQLLQGRPGFNLHRVQRAESGVGWRE